MDPVIDDSIFDEVIYSPVCTFCVHLRDMGAHKCDAFPERIPDLIWRGDNDHTKPFPGDNGVLFERA
jgi:hypothetical protein